jgi:2-oxoisovalerate dehydrogenase E1 component alpha subunit
VIDADGSANGYDPGLSEDELLHCYRAMLSVRAFDKICLNLQRSGRIGFSIPNKGIEATQVGAASALRKTDWFFPSYRDFGMALYHGVEPVAMMHNMFGNALDSAKGRQMRCTSRSSSRSSSIRSRRPSARTCRTRWARRSR